MKLYLSSYRIPELTAFTNFIGKKSADIKLGLILNAKDYKTPSERAQKSQELFDYFSGLGFSVQEINLLEYKRGKGLLDHFKEFDVIWFAGGNTYCLRAAMRQSNCEEIVRKALEAGIVYGGDSAGAIVVGPTLKYFDSADDPTLAAEIIYEGLNLVDFVVLPHWGSVEYGDTLAEEKKHLQADGFKTVQITDSEYLLVDNGKIL